ncbi:MAG: class II aldolase/adducin family protein [Proteobacteria bacterium]|nr:class II aldolase/adducin family protein [Pseudomonadota bacterium]MBU4010759.1 class II aldolase/adducin family protein [Pseudomonadota bacterium]MBU4035245.1 class II aldolase/adducin family protein [Pseudomonadota bacterium]
MENQFLKYEKKLIKSGLAEDGDPLLGILDAKIKWNKKDKAGKVFESIFESLNINSLIFSKPKEPYFSIINYLAKNSDGIIRPCDCETRTFFHDLPVSDKFNTDAIISRLKKRKCVIIPDYGIIATGMVSIEQAFITYSSVCFSCFVKFFSDYLYAIKYNKPDKRFIQIFEKVLNFVSPPLSFNHCLLQGPFNSSTDVLNALTEAGKLMVDLKLVDSFFGNISYCYNDTLFISQTGSSLDELEGCIDLCPLDGSSCAGITASSEFPAHLDIFKKTGHKAILHGHPKFSVILSMDCEVTNCSNKGLCHITCPCKRNVCGIPVVSGEVGSGTCGLCNTVPEAIIDKPGVIVYGHGIFTSGIKDFNEPFMNLLKIENDCYKEYLNRVYTKLHSKR